MPFVNIYGALSGEVAQVELSVTGLEAGYNHLKTCTRLLICAASSLIRVRVSGDTPPFHIESDEPRTSQVRCIGTFPLFDVVDSVCQLRPLGRVSHSVKGLHASLS